MRMTDLCRPHNVSVKRSNQHSVTAFYKQYTHRYRCSAPVEQSDLANRQWSQDCRLMLSSVSPLYALLLRVRGWGPERCHWSGKPTAGREALAKHRERVQACWAAVEDFVSCLTWYTGQGWRSSHSKSRGMWSTAPKQLWGCTGRQEEPDMELNEFNQALSSSHREHILRAVDLVIFYVFTHVAFDQPQFSEFKISDKNTPGIQVFSQRHCFSND